MINQHDVLQSVMSAFSKKLQTTEHHMGKLKGTYQRPFFLYGVASSEEHQETAFAYDTKLIIRSTYYGRLDEDGEEIYLDRLEMLSNLADELRSFYLSVDQRRLKFSYKISEVDGQMTLDLTFNYLDEMVRDKTSESMMEQINFKEV